MAASTPRHLLERHPVFQTSLADELGAFLESKHWLLRLETPPDSARLDARFNGVYLPHLYLGYVRYGVPVTVGLAPSPDHHWLNLIIRGRGRIDLGGTRIGGDGAVAAVTAAGRAHAVSADADVARIHLRFDAGAVRRQLAALLGDDLPGAIDFRPDIDLESPGGAALARSIRYAVAEYDEGGVAFASPLGVAMVEQLLMTTLLAAQPHVASAALRRDGPSIAPRDVKRAVDYIHGHLDRPVTLADLVSASGVAGRTLHKHFRHFKGVSPMAYLRQRRLEAARAELARSDGGGSVTEVALRWGFDHLGRFAVDYRRRFGERPSQTLARRRDEDQESPEPGRRR